MFFYNGDYPLGHKLAQLGELPVTPPDQPRLILEASMVSEHTVLPTIGVNLSIGCSI
jgi:hypothetical protein